MVCNANSLPSNKAHYALCPAQPASSSAGPENKTSRKERNGTIEGFCDFTAWKEIKLKEGA